jgi:hypothetical protein
MENTQKIQGHDVKTLENGTNEVISKLKDKLQETYFVENEEFPVYTLNGDIDELDNFSDEIGNMDLGICDRRRLRRAINRCIVKDSIVTYNAFLRFFNKKLDFNFKMKMPKHDEIQSLRKKWKVLQEQADMALMEYKECKGDFYKQLQEVKEEVAV